eukprot:SAG31_NODE_393_length_16293_cov_15.804372_20_plen_271_part_00
MATEQLQHGLSSLRPVGAPPFAPHISPRCVVAESLHGRRGLLLTIGMAGTRDHLQWKTDFVLSPPGRGPSARADGLYELDPRFAPRNRCEWHVCFFRRPALDDGKNKRTLASHLQLRLADAPTVELHSSSTAFKLDVATEAKGAKMREPAGSATTGKSPRHKRLQETSGSTNMQKVLPALRTRTPRSAVGSPSRVRRVASVRSRALCLCNDAFIACCCDLIPIDAHTRNPSCLGPNISCLQRLLVIRRKSVHRCAHQHAWQLRHSSPNYD